MPRSKESAKNRLTPQQDLGTSNNSDSESDGEPSFVELHRKQIVNNLNQKKHGQKKKMATIFPIAS
jgi:hypothetical protein